MATKLLLALTVLVLPVSAQAYLIEWQGPATPVSDVLWFGGPSDSIAIDHTFSGDTGINDLLFVSSFTEVVVFGPDSGGAAYAQRISRDFVIRRTNAEELPIARTTISGAFDVSLFGAPSPASFVNAGQAITQLQVEVLGTGLKVDLAGANCEDVTFPPCDDEMEVDFRLNFAMSDFLAVNVLYTLQMDLSTLARTRWDGSTARLQRAHALAGVILTVPEPATLGMLGTGLLGLFIRRRRAA